MHRVRAVLLLVLALVVSGLTGLLGAPAANAATTSAHPYSDPIYYPLRVAATLDCVKNNPGCGSPHKDWMMDMVPMGQGRAGQAKDGMSRAGVYAMGAGIVHIGDAHGASCGRETSYGTWIWIDHGAGSLSRYGHLGSLNVREGQYVAAGQQVGTVGTTGKRSNCTIAYVDFSVQHNGLKTSHGVEIATLRACAANGAAQTWPNAVTGKSRWNAVRQGTAFPATTSACIPSTTPTTAARPSKVAIARGKGKLRVRWAAPNSGYRVNAVKIEIAEFHTGKKYWDLPRNSRWVTVSPRQSSVLVSKLTTKRLHRVRVSFHNAAGWSAQTPWRNVKTK